MLCHLFPVQILHCSYVSSECVLVYYVYVTIYISRLFFSYLKVAYIILLWGWSIVLQEGVHSVHILPLTCQVNNFPLCPSVLLPHGDLGCTQHLSSTSLSGLLDVNIIHNLQNNCIWKPFFYFSTSIVLSCLLDSAVLQLQAVWNIAPLTWLKEFFVRYSRWIFRSTVFCNVTSFDPSR